MGGSRAAVFLDMDGTLTIERGHVTDPGDLELIEGAADAVRALNSAGLLVVLVSNQSGVSRGLMTEDDLARLHDSLEAMLSEGGAHLDAAYYCPNFEGGSVPGYTEDTSCRKPAVGMVTRAADDLSIDLESSFVVGDQLTDLELARNAGMAAVLVMTGKGARAEARALEEGLDVAYRARDVADAVSWILRSRTRGKEGS
jgi:D-glycero-D-manno-heptose 1,7-bisphosphate phosphatase